MEPINSSCAVLQKAYPDKKIFTLQDFVQKLPKVAETGDRLADSSLPLAFSRAIIIQHTPEDFKIPSSKTSPQLSTCLSLSQTFESAESIIIQRGSPTWQLPCIKSACMLCPFLYHIGKSKWDTLHEVLGTTAMRWLLSNTSVFCYIENKVYVQVCGPVSKVSLECFARPRISGQSWALKKSAAYHLKRKTGSLSQVFTGPPMKKIKIGTTNQSGKTAAVCNESHVLKEPTGKKLVKHNVSTTTSKHGFIEKVSLPSGSVCHLPSFTKIRLISRTGKDDSAKATQYETRSLETSFPPVKESPANTSSGRRRRKKQNGAPQLVDHRRAFDGSLVITHDDILYSHSGWTHFQIRHPLQRKCSEDLLTSIINTNVGSQVETFTDAQIEPLKMIVRNLHDEHKTFRYNQTLVSVIGRSNRKTRVPLNQNKVYSFLKKTIMAVVPESLLGGSKNMCLFLKIVRRFVEAGRKVCFSLGDFMQGLKTSTCDWLRNVASLAVQGCLLAKVVFWLLTDFIKPLLRQHFYITETTYGRNGLTYFSKPVWQSVRSRKLSQMCPQSSSSDGDHAAGILKRIDDEGAASRKAVIGARLRFVPKQDGLRPIMNATFSQGIDKKLVTNALLLLRTIYEQFPEYVDSKSAADFRQRWLSFLHRRTTPGPVYYVRVDVTDAYGSIQHQKLVSILKRYQKDLPLSAYAKTVSFVDPEGRRSKNFRLLPAVKDMTKFFHSLPQGSIVFDQQLNERLNVAKLVEFIISCVEQVIVTHNNDRFQLCQGVPQGGRLSASLCHLYYGTLVQDHLQQFLVHPDDLLLRVVDDFLYITPDRQRALSFYNELNAGFPDYNCQVNIAKTRTNLTLHMSADKDLVVEVPKKCWASFCGLQFNSHTLNVRGDYSNYERMDVMDCMTVPHGNRPGALLLNRVSMISTLKMQVLYLDPTINNNSRVVRNVYQASLMAAYRFHALTGRVLWTRSRKQTVLNQNFLFRVIETCAGKMCTAVENIGKRWQVKVPLKKAEIKWLCYEAFRRKLGKHRGKYAKLLEQITNYQSCIGVDKVAKLRLWIGKRIPLSFRRMKKYQRPQSFLATL